MADNCRAMLYFIRHGETYLNKYQKMQGWADAPLTEHGEEDAVKTGQRLSQIHFAKIYTSDLGRTLATARIIRDENCGAADLEIIPMKELRESFFGSFEGTYCPEVYNEIAAHKNMDVKDLFGALSLDEMSQAIKEIDPYHEAETQSEIRTRLFRGIRQIVNSAQSGSRIMIVTHGNIIRTVVSETDKTINVNQELKNSGITIMEFKDHETEIIGFNE